MTIAKKTTAKKAVKNATAKPATKKTTTKSVVKKTGTKSVTKPTVKTVTEISVSGNKKIKSLEKEFDTVFGLYAQVCYYTADGHGYYTSGSSDEKTLSAFNAECEKKGCLKGKYR